MRSFSSYHPIVSFVFFVGVSVITMITMHPLLLAFSMAGALLFAATLENSKAVLVSMGFYLPLFLLISVTNPLFSHNGMTPLFFLNDNPVTLEAILCGAAIAGMIVTVVYWARCYQHVMTTDKFLHLFGTVMPKLSLVISMAIRFIPLFTAQVKKIHTVQKTMGLYATKSYADRIMGGFRVFSAIITWSLENAVDTARSMRARGYGLPGRTSYSLFRFTPRDAIMLGVFGALYAWTFRGLWSRTLDFAFYPRLTGLDLSGVAILSYAAVLILVLIPSLTEIKERVAWRYYRSRI